VVAGIAGVSVRAKEVEEQLVGKGIQRERVKVFSDADVLLRSLPSFLPVPSAVLISGTGSVCMARPSDSEVSSCLSCSSSYSS